MDRKPPATIFHKNLTGELVHTKVVDMQVAEHLFNYFKTNKLFRWSDANNDCEDRANALCILLDNWGIPNYKAWVFSGYYLKKNLGSLTNFWNYHVAALVPVQQEDGVAYFVIDPATSPALVNINAWALQITAQDNSYHFIKESSYYIFPKKVEKQKWYKRNKRNYRWTLQGLSGINGVSTKGKAQLSFNKDKVKKTEASFKKLMGDKPAFLH